MLIFNSKMGSIYFSHRGGTTTLPMALEGPASPSSPPSCPPENPSGLSRIWMIYMKKKNDSLCELLIYNIIKESEK